MVKFDEIISASFEWTRAVLFRPFSPKKWLILTFIAFLAGSLSGGNSNFNLREPDRRHKEASAAEQYGNNSLQFAKITSPEQRAAPKKQAKDFFDGSVSGITIFVVILGVAAGIVLFLLLLWLCARFPFIFLDDVIKNDASIAAPFRSNKILGNSLFKFNLAFILIFICIVALIALLGFMSLSGIGAFNKNASVGFFKILSALLPAIILFISVIIIVAIFGMIISDFVIVVMFKDKIKITAAIKKVFSVLAVNKLNLFMYTLIKVSLAIVCSIIYGLVTFMTVMSLLFPAGVTAVIFYFVFKTLPHGAQPVFKVIGVLIVVPIVLFLWYCLMAMYLPFAVFFRTFSIKFLGRLDSRYNLFACGN
jgi:hypothetical protein